MNIIVKVICIILFIAGCTSEINNENSEIKHKWQLTKVLYDNGNVNLLEDGNYIVIKKNTIHENIVQYGSRLYSYNKIKNILYLTSGENSVEWTILLLDNNNLHIQTPIGKYILER